MKRNRFFHRHEPFAGERLTLHRADGPAACLNPTRAHFFYKPGSPATGSASPASIPEGSGRDDSPRDDSEADVPAKNVRFLWRSRDNRKGRHALLVQRPVGDEDYQYQTPRRTSHPHEVLRNLLRTVTYFPIWDISWLVAFIFTMGSVVWVINGFFSWLPLVAPSTEFPNEGTVAGGVSAFIGAIIFFETGSILLFFEAVNANRSGCFGWAVEQLFDERSGPGAGSRYRLIARRSHCRHHHQNSRNFVGQAAASTAPEAQVPKSPDRPQQGEREWRWFPSWHELHTHYLHELGFLAGCSQLFGATVFGISGFTALPGIYDQLTTQKALNGAYWIPQVIGGSGFIVSGTLYMLETQKKWYIPAPKVLGWHIAFWNLIGAVGFTMCGALGMAYGNSRAQYQAALATFWGSWAFLIGSYIQLYESLDKHPVEEVSAKDFA